MHKIFLVHDDQEGPEARHLFLEMAGYEVETMQKGKECLERIVTETPSIVVTDVLIHGMTGFDLCEQIREKFSPKHLPVIICSQFYRGTTFHNEATRVGAQDYLVRPYPLDNLVDDIAKLITAEPIVMGEFSAEDEGSDKQVA